VLDRHAELLDLLQLETGKSRRTAVEELFDVPMGCGYLAETAPGVLADERRAGVAPGMTTATVTYDPVGVVGVISPWNYPLTLSMADALPALVAGNAVVLKPDEDAVRRARARRAAGGRGSPGRPVPSCHR